MRPPRESLSDAPHVAAVRSAVREAYDVAELLPADERWRLAHVLRAHLRAVLRMVARAAAATQEIDRCAELERAVTHCAHLSYLWSLFETLEWISEDSAQRQKSVWRRLRDDLARDAQRLTSAMTLRQGQSRARDRVALVLTKSIPAQLPKPAPHRLPSFPTEEISLRDPFILEISALSDASFIAPTATPSQLTSPQGLKRPRTFNTSIPHASPPLHHLESRDTLPREGQRSTPRLFGDVMRPEETNTLEVSNPTCPTIPTDKDLPCHTISTSWSGIAAID